VPIDQRSSFFRTNTSTTIDLLRAFELRGTLSRILGVAGWSIGKSGVDRQMTYRRLRYSKAEAFRPVASGMAMLQTGKPGDFPRRSM
jgi:hypothetical protein